MKDQGGMGFAGALTVTLLVVVALALGVFFLLKGISFAVAFIAALAVIAVAAPLAVRTLRLRRKP